ncbi:MAG TPA: cytochrome c biogenesis protein CcdA [Bacillota bacterium]|nr:cytochrome c biogenesis protein CcdA [Bacillota bacterium]
MGSITIGMAFLAGLLSFLSPCILPLAPGYLGIMAGSTVSDIKNGTVSRKRIILAALYFVLGFSLIFVLLGLTSSFLGQLLMSHRQRLVQIGGVIVILFGLHQTGLLPIQFLYKEKKFRINRPEGYIGSFLLGIAFAIGWTPCIGPILGSILTLAGSQGDLSQGVLLLSMYSMGLAFPFILLALAFERITLYLSRFKPMMKYLEWASGLLLIVMGILLLTNNLALISSWFVRLLGGWNPERLLR